jgi:medium-chain acyl-[acyl-carrier-protein] hydrolase
MTPLGPARGSRSRAPVSPWLVRFGHTAGTRRLVCFPYAGGNASAYARWHRLLPTDNEVWAVELPGRSRRLHEPPLRHAAPAVSAVCEAISRLDDKAFALFGHSMGALLAFETAAALVAGGMPRPSAVVVSGLPALDRVVTDPERDSPHASADLVDRLRQWGGTPPEVLASPELLDLVLPALQADLRMCSNYQRSGRAPLPVPLAAFGGRSDVMAPVPDLMPWSQLTTDWRGLWLFDGGHFFIRSEERAVLAALVAVLGR